MHGLAEWLAAVSVAVWWTQSISRGKAGRAGAILACIQHLGSRLFNGESHRSDLRRSLDAIVASGLFEECLSGVASLADAGVDQLGDVDHGSLLKALSILNLCLRQPGAEARIRSLAPALEWCLAHDLDCLEQLGMTTGSYAAQICESLWPLIVVGPYSCSNPVHCRRLWRLRAR